MVSHVYMAMTIFWSGAFLIWSDMSQFLHMLWFRRSAQVVFKVLLQRPQNSLQRMVKRKKGSSDREVDWSGDRDARLSRAGVIVSHLEGAPDELRGFLGTIDWFGRVFNPGGHRSCRLQSWLSHFALILEFATEEHEAPKDFWLLERTESGVKLRQICPHDNPGFHKNFRWDWWLRCDSFFPQDTGSGSRVTLCNVSCCEKDFSPQQVGYCVTRRSVHDFVRNQMHDSYNVMTKNCKHLAYDFLRNCLHHDWIKHRSFPDVSEMLEEGWVEHR